MQTLASAANPTFAVGTIAVPLALLAATYVVATNGEWRGLFYVHVATGALWFSVAIFFPAVLGPTIGSLDPPAARQFSATFTPKVVFFVTGISLTAVLSGTLLADVMGLFDLSNPLAPSGLWITVALAVGWGLWLFGLVVPNRLHLKAYYEGQSADPDPSVLAGIERRTLVVGLFEAGVMLAIIYVMTNLRF